jgi:hypothetical protein
MIKIYWVLIAATQLAPPKNQVTIKIIINQSKIRLLITLNNQLKKDNLGKQFWKSFKKQEFQICILPSEIKN